MQFFHKKTGCYQNGNNRSGGESIFILHVPETGVPFIVVPMAIFVLVVIRPQTVGVLAFIQSVVFVEVPTVEQTVGKVRLAKLGSRQVVIAIQIEV
jgi:hypothetical protein